MNGQRIVQTAEASFGSLDILINNAGILKDKSMKNMTQIDWDTVININLNGTFSVTKAAWAIMREKRYGKIINTGSSSGLYGNIG